LHFTLVFIKTVWHNRASSAGVAQLVERNLAKVEVESSRLFSRSRIQDGSPRAAVLRSGVIYVRPPAVTMPHPHGRVLLHARAFSWVHEVRTCIVGTQPTPIPPLVALLFLGTIPR
jgi:hypothetical protein